MVFVQVTKKSLINVYFQIIESGLALKRQN